MPPRKRSKSNRKKIKTPSRRAKPASAKKPSAKKKPAGRGARVSVPVTFAPKGTARVAKSEKAETADTLGDWQHEHGEQPDTTEFTEDDIPPDYGGSE